MLIGRWLVASGFLLPAFVLGLFSVLSFLLEPKESEWVAYLGGFSFIASLALSLVLLLVGSGLSVARVVRAREGVTKTDYLFLALGVNGALFLLVAAAVIFHRT